MKPVFKRFLLALAAAAFAGASAVQAGTPKNTFVMAKDVSDIITLDPAEVFELSGGEIIANIYDRLMMFEPKNLTKLVGGVAESWDVSGDGKSIVFKILPGLKFHSGNPVTAQDVAFSPAARRQAQQDPGVHRHAIRMEQGQRLRSRAGRGRQSREGHYHRGVFTGPGAECAVRRDCVHSSI